MTATRILVVDDEKNIRLTLQQTLASDDTVVDTAVNGEEALKKLAAGDYQLVLLDLRLPGIDGLEVLRRMGELKSRVPVILLSAHGTVKSAVEALHGGAVDFLEKPFAPREVRDAVARALAAGPSKGPRAKTDE